MESQIQLSSNCPVCNKCKVYKSKQALTRFKNKPCKSCSNSIISGGSGSVLPIDGHKKCFKCNIVKPLSEFYFYKIKNRYHSLCNNCKLIASNLYFKELGKYKRYGVTKEEYDLLAEKQNHSCAICKSNTKKLYIDHNHKTNKIRGLLCRECNSALGFLKDDKQIIANAMQYIGENNK
jgi:hypothetical protein